MKDIELLFPGERLSIPYSAPDEPIIRDSTHGVLLQESHVDYQITLPNIPVRPGSVFMSITDTSFPNYDDGLGNILGKGGYGTINYATGLLKMRFDLTISTLRSLHIHYAQDFEYYDQEFKEKPEQVSKTFLSFMK